MGAASARTSQRIGDLPSPATGSTGARVGGLICELVAPRHFELREQPAPEAGAGEAVVRISAVGICGTDLHYFAGRPRAGAWTGGPWVLGHDASAVVESVGPGAAADLVGRRVTIDPKWTCGVCEWCRAGRASLCPAQYYLGMSSPGCLAEQVAVPTAQLVPLPPGVSDAAATCLEPVAVALELEKLALPLLLRARQAAIVGGGPLGIIVASVLSARGWTPSVFEPLELRRELAARCGIAALPAEPADLGPEPRLVVETSASPQGVALAGQLCTAGSVVGVVGNAPTGIAHQVLLGQGVTVVPVRGGAGHYPEAVRLAAGGAVAGEELVTHRRPLAEVQEAFEEATGRPGTVLRTMLSFPSARATGDPVPDGASQAGR